MNREANHPHLEGLRHRCVLCRIHPVGPLWFGPGHQPVVRAHIAELYGFRWNTELDIRSIKSTLNLDHLRCKTPAMVLAEVWATILAYKLIRTTVAGAAALHDKQPRQISFTAACQYILSTWMMLSASRTPVATLRELRLRLFEQIASCEVADRPGRFEPRVIKRRKHRYPLMKQPRADLKRGIATSKA